MVAVPEMMGQKRFRLTHLLEGEHDTGNGNGDLRFRLSYLSSSSYVFARVAVKFAGFRFLTRFACGRYSLGSRRRAFQKFQEWSASSPRPGCSGRAVRLTNDIILASARRCKECHLRSGIRILYGKVPAAGAVISHVAMVKCDIASSKSLNQICRWLWDFGGF
jgi:hypothetical protein